MRNRAGKAVEFPNGHYVEFAPMTILHEPVELWSPVFRTRYSRVDVFTGDLPASPAAMLSQLA
jgi:hypothetical protein